MAEREVNKQTEDENGRTRLDRPFTAEEAKELDARNRERLTAGRTGRFEPFLSGTEKQARVKRSKVKTSLGDGPRFRGPSYWLRLERERHFQVGRPPNLRFRSAQAPRLRRSHPCGLSIP